MNKYDVVINVKEVTWANGKPVKYQATATITQGLDRDYKPKVIKRIYSDPMPTEKQAKQSLLKECNLWRETAVEACTFVKEQLEAEEAVKQ